MMLIGQILLAAALSIWGLTASAQDPKTYYNISDDGYAIVPIPFGFPYFGRVFTHSIFFDNGLVSFYDPQTEGMRLGGQNFYAQPLSNNIGSNFHYSIMPLWSDLRNYSGSYYTQTDSQSYLRYNWENISQYGYPDRLNSFDLEIRPTGSIGINYTKINIGGYPITAGLVGNAQLGEWNQHYYKPPQDTATLSSIQNWSVPYTEGTDCSNPLNNQYCPGYQQAFFEQQCNANPLYSSSCPGYQQAFFEQQCNANPLYSTLCSGYATAYYNYQCSVNALYHTGCPGYAAAYFDQQCGSDPLYNNQCPGYDDAYYVQQCTASSLYDSGCDGYAEAYFDQQCSLDGLYNNQCPNYGDAYAKKYILITSTTETVIVAQATVSETKEGAATAAATEPAPAPAVSASPAAAATAPVSLVSAPAPAAPTEKTAETPTETASAGGGAGESKNKPATTRQALAQRRLAAARAAAAKAAQDNPGAVAAQMDSAASMEQQVELQNVVLGAMGFVAGFDAYGRAVLPDAVGYRPFEIYRGQRNVDSAAARGLLGRSDRIHQDMVDSQYNK